MLENVKNLVSHDSGNTFKVIRRALEEELGYTVEAARARCKPVRSAGPPPHLHRRLRQRDELRLRHGCDPGFITQNEPDPSPRRRLRGHRIPVHQGALGRVADKYTLTPKLWDYLQNYAIKHRKAGNGFGFGLVGPDDVARTLSARYYKDGSEILVSRGHGNVPRRLTPRECARLMGFPESYRIPVSDTQAYKQFGNSVVVP